MVLAFLMLQFVWGGGHFNQHNRLNLLIPSAPVCIHLIIGSYLSSLVHILFVKLIRIAYCVEYPYRLLPTSLTLSVPLVTFWPVCYINTSISILTLSADSVCSYSGLFINDSKMDHIGVLYCAGRQTDRMLLMVMSSAVCIMYYVLTVPETYSRYLYKRTVHMYM